jgi:NADH dehydrogenase
MSLAVVGGSNFLGRYLIQKLAPRYKDIRLADMYPHRPAVYRLQDEIGDKLVKQPLSYPNNLKAAILGADDVLVVTHDYFKLAFDKEFFLQRTASFAKNFGVKRLIWVAPMELDQLNTWEGDPAKRNAECEAKAVETFPAINILRTNLIFGHHASSLLIQHALQLLSHNESPILYNDGKTVFEPVFEEDVLNAMDGLKPGDKVVLGGPEKLSWKDMAKVLAAHCNYNGSLNNGPLGQIKGMIAKNKFVGDLYPSQLQQFYRILDQQAFIEPTTRQGNKKLEEVFLPGQFKGVENKAWHRVACD